MRLLEFLANRLENRRLRELMERCYANAFASRIRPGHDPERQLTAIVLPASPETSQRITIDLPWSTGDYPRLIDYHLRDGYRLVMAPITRYRWRRIVTDALIGSAGLACLYAVYRSRTRSPRP